MASKGQKRKLCPGCSLVCKMIQEVSGSTVTIEPVTHGIASIVQEYQTKRAYLNIITVPHVSEFSTVANFYCIS